MVSVPGFTLRKHGRRFTDDFLRDGRTGFRCEKKLSASKKEGFHSQTVVSQTEISGLITEIKRLMAAKKRSGTENMRSLFRKEVSTCKSIFSFPKTMGERTMTMVEINERCIPNVFKGLTHVCEHGVRDDLVMFIKVFVVSNQETTGSQSVSTSR